VGDINLNGFALTLAYAKPQEIDIVGTISGSGSVSLASGDLVLAKANSYTGQTLVQGGRLTIHDAAAATPERTTGAAERASLRDGRHASDPPAGPHEYLETARGPRRRFQPRPVDADAHRRRHSSGLQGRLGAMIAMIVALTIHVLGRCRDETAPSSPEALHVASSFRTPISSRLGKRF
jgi:autotransporter-associated beta strand protein